MLIKKNNGTNTSIMIYNLYYVMYSKSDVFIQLFEDRSTFVDFFYNGSRVKFVYLKVK